MQKAVASYANRIGIKPRVALHTYASWGAK